MFEEKRDSQQEHTTDYSIIRCKESTVGGENGKLVWTFVEAQEPAS
jgi:hypothetical protein